MSDSCCQAPIDTSAIQGRQRRVLLTVLAINVAAFFLMIGGSLLSGSSALLSGTLDNLGDAVTYALSFAVVGATAAAKARVAFFKGLMILAAAIAVALQIAWHLLDPQAPVVGTMGAAALLNLGANLFCLRLLTPYRRGDLNMSSAWECSRNDVFEGLAVLATTGATYVLASGWPDIAVAVVLLVLFLRSALRVLGAAARELRSIPTPS